MTRKPSEYDSTTYKRNRELILRDGPICHWCRKRPATTADHLLEIAAGGDSTLDNMIPSCKPCNSSRGATYKNKRDAQRIQTRNEILNRSETNDERTNVRFLGGQDTTPSPSQLFIKNGQNWPELATTGRDLPRLETISPEAVGSWGALVGDMASQYLGVELMEWQRHYLDRALGFAPADDGEMDLVHRSSCLSVARQNGKTTIAQSLILFWLVEMPKIRGHKQTVVSTAHRLDLACLLFDELAPILEKEFGAHIIWSYGRYQATMKDGSRWFVKAPRPSIGHGMSIDLAIADEIFDISEAVLSMGLEPAQRARRSPHMALFSTAGTESSTAFIRYRENGLRLIDEGKPSPFLFMEWSPPPDLDPMSDAAFGWGNPSLGVTLRPETIRAERDGPDRAAYLRSSMNLWITVSKGWIEVGRWPALRHEGQMPAGGVIAIEASMDESRFFGVRASPLPDGRVVCTVAFMAETYSELWEKIHNEAKDLSVRFAISPTIDVHCPPNFERRRVVVGYGEILKYTPVVKQMIHEGRVLHMGETMLAEHVQRAVAVRTQGSVAVSSQRSPGPIELCRCLIWAAAMAARPTQNSKPLVFVMPN